MKWLNGTIMDHTREKELEDELIEARKMASLGTLVGGIAHEFNNTLAGMTGQLYLAKKEVHVPAVTKRLEAIEGLSFKVAGMIKQLLAFAHKDLVQMRSVSLSSCVKEALKLNSVVTPPRAIFRQDISSDELIVSGDQVQLQQVVINLIRNACDAVAGNEHGEVSVLLDSFEADETFLVRNEDVAAHGFAHLAVSDNGVGIAIEDMDKVFDPFFTTKEVGKGTGLGLSMVYGAVKGHGGIIEINSELGAGTQVHIYIPLHDEEGSEAEQQQSTEIVQGAGETILLVDDNLSFLETNRDIIASMNYRVLTADNGVKACELFREKQHEIDLVITDLVMPLMGGVEAAAVFRSIQPDVKIIFATGYDRNESLLQGEKMSGETIIFKPFEIEKMSAVIHHQLHH
ncbi:response regulator [Mariprofundus sp. NF]|nr:response regulator [Mariprofundus sp. NF]